MILRFPSFSQARFTWFLIILFSGSLVTSNGDDSVEVFLETHCLSCHGPEKEKGDLRIDDLSREFQLGLDSHIWAEVIEKINSGEMPPEDEPQPTQGEISAFVSTLDQLIKDGKAARMAARPPVAHYRLSRKEYQNTIYDLLGVRYDPSQPGGLNEDTLWHGFERIGSQLSLSPSHVDRYFRAAEITLDRALSSAAEEPLKVRMTAAELRYNGGEVQQEALDRFDIKRPLRYLHFPGRVQPVLRSHWFKSSGRDQSGLYRFRMKASGIRPPGGQPAHVSIGKKTSEENVDGLIEFDVTASEDDPQIYEFEVFLEMPAELHLAVVATDVIDRRGGAAFRNALGSTGNYIFTHSSETLLLNPSAPQMFDDKGNGIFSTVIVDWIEWEGPIVSDAEQSRRNEALLPDEVNNEGVAKHLKAFAERSWRRPIKDDELDIYLDAYRAELDSGFAPSEAFRTALQGILTSRHFIYLVEGDPVEENTAAREKLNDWELASRLSYFLWSSMPDAKLFNAAHTRTLQGKGLKLQVERMLKDERFDRFIEDFSRQWLQLHRVGMFPPDRKLYPTYDDWLEVSMRNEPVEYFREMLNHNLPIDAFLNSDWTMANARLRDFYGMPEPKTEGFQRVSLSSESSRGGLLTMGAILGLTSDGTRHRPVHRGVWLSETLFNKTPPPPPANVDPIEPVPPEGDKVTVRQRLEVHATDANCAGCHSKIDPLGFAWDNYDAIGQWRDHEGVPTGVGANPIVDASGKMPDGRSFATPAEFKELLLDDRDKVARAFIEHLCTYALRRVLTVDDEEDIQQIVTEAKKSGYQLEDIIRHVALSDLLQKR